MAIDLTDVRVFVYRWFADRGDAPAVRDVAAAFGADDATALEALRALHDAHLLVLDANRRQIVMAHPWSAASLGFVVASDRQKWWGGCAWDSFAIPSLLGQTCLVATRCPGCGNALALDVAPDEPPAQDWVAHFLVPVTRMWDDVVFTCSNQLLFCSHRHVGDWLHRTGNELGTILDLPTLWSLATGWYAGRLTRQYQRRTPAEAAVFFKSVGLTSPFWRTD